jgi:cobalamin biosynthetic protein CobC
VSSVSLAIAEARVRAGLDDVARHVQIVRCERARLEALLRRSGAAVTRSHGNFAFARFADARVVRDALGRRGVSVRAFADTPIIRDGLRITVPGDKAEFEKLMAALEEILGVAEREESPDGE